MISWRIPFHKKYQGYRAKTSSKADNVLLREAQGSRGAIRGAGPPKGIPCYGYFHGRMCRTALGALGDLWWVLGARGFLWGSWGLVGGRGERTDRTRAFIRRQYGAHGPPATASAKVRRRPGEKARPRAVAGLGQCYSDW